MNEPKTTSDDNTEIIQQIAGLSKLLGMIPADDSITINDPVTNTSMELSKWFSDARHSFFKLSLLIDKALDLKLQP